MRFPTRHRRLLGRRLHGHRIANGLFRRILLLGHGRLYRLRNREIDRLRRLGDGVLRYEVHRLVAHDLFPQIFKSPALEQLTLESLSIGPRGRRHLGDHSRYLFVSGGELLSFSYGAQHQPRLDVIGRLRLHVLDDLLHGGVGGLSVALERAPLGLQRALEVGQHILGPATDHHIGQVDLGVIDRGPQSYGDETLLGGILFAGLHLAADLLAQFEQRGKLTYLRSPFVGEGWEFAFFDILDLDGEINRLAPQIFWIGRGQFHREGLLLIDLHVDDLRFYLFENVPPSDFKHVIGSLEILHRLPVQCHPQVGRDEVTLLDATVGNRTEFGKLVPQTFHLSIDLGVLDCHRVLSHLNPFVFPKDHLGHDGDRGLESQRFVECGDLIVQIDLRPVYGFKAQLGHSIDQPARHRLVYGVDQDGLVAQALSYHGYRGFARPETRKAHLARQLSQTVVEGFPQFFAGNLDRKLDRVSIALTEGRLHVYPFSYCVHREY